MKLLQPLVALLAGLVIPPSAEEGWISLFDGKSFAANWEIESRIATYRVEDGAIEPPPSPG